MVHISLARVRFSKNRRKCTSEKQLASDVTWLYWKLKILSFQSSTGEQSKNGLERGKKRTARLGRRVRGYAGASNLEKTILIRFDTKTDCFAVYICKVCTSLATLENCCIFVKWHNSLRTTSERASLYGVLRKDGF